MQENNMQKYDDDDDIITELQRHIRGLMARRRFRNEIRWKLQNEIKSKTLCKNTNLLHIGLILFNSAYIPEEETIFLFCNLLNLSMRSTSIPISYGSLFLSSKYMDTSSRLILRYAKEIIQIIGRLDVLKITDARKLATFISSLSVFCNCSENNWPILKDKKDMLQIIDNLCAKTLAPIATDENICTLMRIISSGLKGPRQPLSGQTLDQLFFVLIRLMEISSLEFELGPMPKILVDFLKIPTVTLSMNDESLKKLESSSLYVHSIKLLSSDLIITQLTTRDSLNLLANMLHLGYKFKNVHQDSLLDWAYLVNQLLENCSKRSSNKRKNNHCWHHPLLGWMSERVDDNMQWLYPRLYKQISLLWSKEMVEYLSRNFLTLTKGEKMDENGTEPKESKTGKTSSFNGTSIEKLPADFLQKFIGKISIRSQSSRKQYERMGNIQAVSLPPISLPIILCQLYQNALFAFHNSRIDILSSLSRDDSLILAKLWQYISLSNGNGLRTYLGYLVTDSDVKAPQFAPLHLFGEIAYSLISILDEKEMYEAEKPFTQEQLRSIANFVNNFCFHIIWNSLIDFDQLRPAALFSSMYQLLNILYVKNCRRPFTTDATFWIIPEICTKAFIIEFEKTGSNLRAHQLMEKMPHIIPLKDRIFLFRKFISQDKEMSNLPTTIITVERSRLIEDGYRQLGGLNGHSIRGTVRVKFINQQGLDEAGIDQDGVFKEFLELTLKKVFTPELNLFKCTHDKLLYPSSTSNIQENHLELFNFVGRMLGKAVYEGICVDVQLAPVLLASVLGKQLSPFDELASVDPLLYKNLTYVKHYNDSDDLEDLALTFSFQEEFLGKIYTHELIAGGRDLKVTNQNKISYLHLMAHYKVVKQIREQTKSFVNGFHSIIKEKWISLFSIHELQFLISGQISDIDMEDLKKHVQYYGGFHSNHRLIRWLWSILDDDFTAEERRLFLKFVTSCSRPPLLGFAYLEPSFSIRCIETSDDLDQGDTLGSVIRGFLAINKKKQPVNERLPTASTCFNLLKLPNYTKRYILLEKLRYAIHSETGFELS